MNIKKKKGQRIEKCLWLEKDNEGKLLNERLIVYRQSPIRYFPLNQKESFKNQKVNILKDTRDFKFIMAVNYNCDGKFNSNILIVGQTFCGKTTFIQNLAENRIFGDIKSVL